MQNAAAWGEAERKRVETVVETLAALRGDGEDLAEVAHDARNMVTALGLYCDLLEEPGVLAAPFAHYGDELRLVAAASRRLVEKLLILDAQRTDVPASGGSAGKKPVKAAAEGRARSGNRWDLMPSLPIDSLAVELTANRNLLAALAGPGISLTVDAEGGALPVRLTGEDLTRVLVNLVKNAAEAMPTGGGIRLLLRERPAGVGTSPVLTLAVEDDGPGIPPASLDRIFEAGFSTRSAAASDTGWPAVHRGLGLSITRSIVEAAGGRVHSSNRKPGGARLEIELPARSR